jgi:hypothetical protein
MMYICERITVNRQDIFVIREEIPDKAEDKPEKCKREVEE